MSGLGAGRPAVDDAPVIGGLSPLIQNVAQFLGGLDAIWTLRAALGVDIPGSPPAMQHTIVNVLTTGSFFNDRSKLTEIGLVAFSVSDLHDLVRLDPGFHAENILARMYFYHYRYIPNAHLGISKDVAASPEYNRFGNTRFVDEKQMRDLIQDSFCWPIDDNRPELGFSPVVLLGHTLELHLNQLQQSLGIDVWKFRTIAKAVDTRQMAYQIGMGGPFPTGLGHLMNRFAIAHKNVGTAGNDAAYTAIVSVLLALSPELYRGEHPLHPNNTIYKLPQQVVDGIEAHSKTVPGSSYGVIRYCTKCARMGHLRKYCRTIVQCQKCVAAGREKSSLTHVDSRCGFNS